MATSRRDFLKGSAAAVGAILIPFSKPALAVLVSDASVPPLESTEINDWIWIDREGNTVIGVSQCEVGQGVYTGLPQVLADEMDADWDKVSVQFVTGRDAYRTGAAYEPLQQFVGASMSATKFYARLRHAGAQARDLFLRAGAEYLGVRPTQCQTRQGRVVHLATERSIGYGDLLEAAATLTLSEDPPLKPAPRHDLIGRPLARVDTPAKVDGSAQFGIDVEVPDMLVGVPRMAPSLTGKVVRIHNEEAILAYPGVKGLVTTSTWPLPIPTTVVVVAETFWQAKRAADALDVEFDSGPAAGLSNATIARDNQAALDAETAVTVTDLGDTARLLGDAKQAGRLLEADFITPYVTHATMEPCNATAHYQGDRIETWGPFQGQDFVRENLARLFDIEAANVVVNTTYLGGSFGRKFLPDAVVHAALASREVGKPVKVIYTREEDTRHSYYRPGCTSRFQAVLGDDGYPQALRARYAGQSLYGVIKKEKMQAAGGWDETMVECVYDMRYQIPNLRVEATDVKQPIPVSFLRGVGSTSSVFYLESFISELAHEAGIDEFEYRRQLLKGEALATRVLDATARAAEWGKPLPADTYRGMAFNIWTGRGMAFETHVALAVEVSVSGGRVRVDRAVCGLDCGKAINPGLIKANIEGGIGFALTGAFKSEMHFEDGQVAEANFTDYPLIGIAEMPAVEVVIVDSERPPQGCGEVACAVVAPAVASALFKATGKHHRRMPLPQSVA